MLSVYFESQYQQFSFLLSQNRRVTYNLNIYIKIKYISPWSVTGVKCTYI